MRFVVLLCGLVVAPNVHAMFGRRTLHHNRALSSKVTVLECDIAAAQQTELGLLEKIRLHRNRAANLTTAVRTLQRRERESSNALASALREAERNATIAAELAAFERAVFDENMTAAIAAEKAKWTAARTAMQTAFEDRNRTTTSAFEAKITEAQAKLAESQRIISELERSKVDTEHAAQKLRASISAAATTIRTRRCSSRRSGSRSPRR